MQNLQTKYDSLLADTRRHQTSMQ